jgi:3-dehydroquinate synthase
VKEQNGIRKQLNFGHTVGHAIEALSLKTKKPLLHGEAIAIGMVAETRMSGNADGALIESLLLRWGLPISISGISQSQINSVILTDKKNKAGEVLWSLPKRIGNVESDRKLTKEIINQGILSIIS